MRQYTISSILYRYTHHWISCTYNIAIAIAQYPRLPFCVLFYCIYVQLIILWPASALTTAKKHLANLYSIQSLVSPYTYIGVYKGGGQFCHCWHPKVTAIETGLQGQGINFWSTHVHWEAVGWGGAFKNLGVGDATEQF